MQQHNLQTKKKMKQEIFFFLFNCKMKQQRENDEAQNQENKIKF
jgi:hypothetical protein